MNKNFHYGQVKQVRNEKLLQVVLRGEQRGILLTKSERVTFYRPRVRIYTSMIVNKRPYSEFFLRKTFLFILSPGGVLALNAEGDLVGITKRFRFFSCVTIILSTFSAMFLSRAGKLLEFIMEKTEWLTHIMHGECYGFACKLVLRLRIYHPQGFKLHTL